MADSLPDAVADAHNVLVLASGTGDARHAVCESLLGDAPAVLAVSLRTSGAEWVAAHAVGSVHVVETGASTVETSRVVDSPEDLPGLEIAVGEPVDEMGASGAVCVDSLTTLLDAVDLTPAYRFLHGLTARVADRGVTGHYHVDPDAHDAAELARLATLFDAMVGVGVALPPDPDVSFTIRGSEVEVLCRPRAGEGNA